MLPVVIIPIAAAAGYAVLKTFVMKDSHSHPFSTMPHAKDEIRDIVNDMRELYATPQDTNNQIKKAYDVFFLPREDPWVPPEREITVRGISIRGGLFSCGTNLPERDGFGSDPSLVNPELPIASGAETNLRTTRDDADYATLSPELRFTYLKWLASDRTDHSLPEACIWIYLYGLERRLLIDGPKRNRPTNEHLRLINELLRISHVFTQYKDIQAAIKKILCMEWTSNNSPQRMPNAQNYVDFDAPECAEIFPWRLSSLAMQHRPLPPNVICTWYRLQNKIPVLYAASHYPDLFDRLFAKRYVQMPPLYVTPSHIPLVIRYHAVSPAIGELCYSISGAYTAFNQIAPLKRLEKEFNACNAELSKLSRFAMQSNAPISALARLTHMPAKLREKDACFIAIGNHLRQSISKHTGMVEIHTLIDIISRDNTFEKDDIQFIPLLLEQLGYYCAPDPRYHDVQITPDDILIITPSNGPIDDSTSFHMIAMVLRLGAIIAQFDRNIAPEEVRVLQEIILKRKFLTDRERASLLIWLHWCLHTPQNVEDVTRKLPKSIAPSLKKQISLTLIAVATADHHLAPEEKEMLIRLYRALGLDENRIDEDIEDYQTKNAQKESTENSEQNGIDVNKIQTAGNSKETFQVFKDNS